MNSKDVAVTPAKGALQIALVDLDRRHGHPVTPVTVRQALRYSMNPRSTREINLSAHVRRYDER